VIDWISGILLVLGALFMAVAALGVYRMPDLYMRMSSSTKASTFGAMLLLGGVALSFLDPATSTKAIAVILFLFVTTPVAAHMIARAAYHTGVKLWEGTHVDELAGPARDGAGKSPEP
jgi:multicomponent Na+:H+ antiporter subunit G